MTASEALAAACESGISCLDERDLLVVIAQSLSGGLFQARERMKS